MPPCHAGYVAAMPPTLLIRFLRHAAARHADVARHIRCCRRRRAAEALPALCLPLMRRRRRHAIAAMLMLRHYCRVDAMLRDTLMFHAMPCVTRHY